MQGIDDRLHTCGRRHCYQCKRWKHVIDFYPKKRRLEDDVVMNVSNNCKVCDGENSRKRTGTKRRYNQIKPLTNAERCQRRREALKNDPIKLAAKREYQRMWANMKRREQGKPEHAKRPPKDPTGYHPSPRGHLVKAKDFIDWLEAKRIGMELDRYTLAQLLKIDASQLDRMYGQDCIRMETVDEYASRLGHPEVIHLLYGDV